MAKTAKIEVKDQNIVESLNEFLKKILQEGELTGIMVARHLPAQKSVMPAFITDPEKIGGSDPLAPAFPMNAAKVVSKLTRKPIPGQVAAVLRPCEIRAFIELVKLKQGRLEDVVLIGFDCLGAYSNINYSRFAKGEGIESTIQFYKNIKEGKGTAHDGFDLSSACKACEYPMADNADISIGIMGMDLDDSLLIIANTEKGEDLLRKISVTPANEPADRKKAVDELIKERLAYRDQMFKETSEATNDIEKLTSYLSNCVNCYNCRVACPVCYCKECVFVTDVFDHEPVQYLKWAKQKGVLKMPTDTVFYHLTRLAHMSTACIGCGQCSNACPNEIPVMEVFRTISYFTQKAFDYVPGRSVEEAPPLSTFREEEFKELTGGKD